jgi:branched-chain amino acid transport system substrate-binding protein
MDLAFDKNGDIERESFLIKVEGGKQTVVATLPALPNK